VKVFSLNSLHRWEWTELPSDNDVNPTASTPCVKAYSYNPDLKQWEWISTICQSNQLTSPAPTPKVYAYNTTTQQYSWNVDQTFSNSNDSINLASSSGAVGSGIKHNKQPIEVYSLDEESDEWILTSNLVYSFQEASGEWAWRRVTIEQPHRKKKSLTPKLPSTSASSTSTIREFSLSEGSADSYQWSTITTIDSSGGSGVVGDCKVYSLQPEGWRWVSKETHAAYIPPSSVVVKSKSSQTSNGSEEKKESNGNQSIFFII